MEGGDYDYAHDLAFASDGGVVAAGMIHPSLAEASNWLRRYSATGEVAWTVESPWGDEIEGIWAVAVDHLDRVGLAGWLTTEDHAEYIWAAKHRANGERAWSVNLGAGRGAEACFAPDGALYVTGGIADPEHSGYTLLWVGKLAADGTLLWAKTESRLRPAQNRGRALVCDETGGVVVFGTLLRPDPDVNSGYSYGWIRRYDAAGEELWTTTIGEDCDSGVGPEEMLLGPTGDELLVTVHILDHNQLYRVGLEDGAIRSDTLAPDQRMLAADAGGLLVDGAFARKEDPECDEELEDCYVHYYGYAYFDWDAELVWWRAESSGAPGNSTGGMHELAARDGTLALAGQAQGDIWVCYR